MVSQTRTGTSQPIRTLFLSDVHLGSRHSQTEPLLDFLSRYIPSKVYLVGDFLDGWQWRAGCWQKSYSRILNIFEFWADRGATIQYTPGNHDSFLRDPMIARVVERQLGFIEIADEFEVDLTDGRRFLVMHGDQFDCVEGRAQWLSRLSTSVYDSVLTANWYLSRWFARRDVSPYDLCARAKKRVKQVIRFLSGFESAILDYARNKGCQGVVCGHLHTPVIAPRGDMTYCNTGDWVENCSAIVEHDDGQLSLEQFYSGAVRRKTPLAPLPRPVPTRKVDWAANPGLAIEAAYSRLTEPEAARS